MSRNVFNSILCVKCTSVVVLLIFHGPILIRLFSLIFVQIKNNLKKKKDDLYSMEIVFQQSCLRERKGGLAWHGDLKASGLEDGPTWEGLCLGEVQALTWLWDVLVTPQTVVTTEREPGGWLVFCCQGTGS